MKTIATAKLSKNSFNDLTKYLEKYRSAIEDGTKSAIEKLTEATLIAVKSYCYSNGIVNHTSNIKSEYNKETNTGKVFTNDSVIIFNEMGTGVTGKNSPHPKPNKNFISWKYDINNRGEKGWIYPKEDGTFGWTKGLPSRHMFYDAFKQIEPLVKPTITIEITKTIKDIY